MYWMDTFKPILTTSSNFRAESFWEIDLWGNSDERTNGFMRLKKFYWTVYWTVNSSQHTINLYHRGVSLWFGKYHTRREARGQKPSMGPRRWINFREWTWGNSVSLSIGHKLAPSPQQADESFVYPSGPPIVDCLLLPKIHDDNLPEVPNCCWSRSRWVKIL